MMDDRLVSGSMEGAVRRLLGENGYAQVWRDIDQPSGLPSVAYLSDEWLALENQNIFQRNWVFATAAAELPEPGAMRPMEIGGAPVMLVRGEDDEIRAFHNFCRHRGTQLLTEPCVAMTVTCPYHAWVYRLNGRLRSRPHFHGPGKLERFENGAGERLDLAPVRCESWNGCVFVNISGDAPPLLEWLAPLLRRTQAFDFSQIRWIGSESYRIESNWKLVLENYMEGYHVFAAHPRLIAHAPMEVRWSGEWLDHVFYNDYVAPKLSEGRGDGLPHYAGLADEDVKRGMWFAAFPNFAAQVFADQFVVLAIYPTSPGETHEDLHFFVVGDEAATAPKYETARADLKRMWRALNLEDVELLERLQLGRLSPAFDGSMMSPAWEGPSHELARKVVEEILRD